MPKTDLTEPAGCYIHIPFCLRKCLYCDFYSVADLTRIPGFLTALFKEIEITPTDELHFDTLYLGGGTPSVLGAEAVGRIIRRTLASFSFDRDVEITVEVNPASVGPDDFEVYRSAGVNRLNIGAQSFDDDRLGFLGRIHTSGQAANCISDARRAGFTNLGIDLIYGIPEQTPQQWQKDLELALAFSPEHLSCYMLTYEDGTPLHGKMTRGRFQPLGEGPVAELFKLTASFLESRGYEHYEISNFARQDRQSKSPWRSRHNQKYWSLAPYIGLGPSAHSYRHLQRYWNSGRLRDYLQALSEDRLPVEERETLTAQQQMMEMVYLGIRTRNGIDTVRFENTFGVSFAQEYGDTLKTLEEQGMIRMEPGRCIPTHQGMRFADSIAALLLD